MKNRVCLIAPRLFAIFLLLAMGVFVPLGGLAQEVEKKLTIDQRIDQAVKPVADFASSIVFKDIPFFGGQRIPLVLLVLGLTACFLTLYFRFINFRGFRLALRTVRGRYSTSSDPGEISHFEALSAALSATVGLGNIAGVAVAIGIGGPGATFWMILMGFFGMTTKFAECTLGVKYRKIDEHGRVRGGAMYYLTEGLRERGAGAIGSILAVLFAIFVIGGAFGAGNMYQANQSQTQFANSFAPNLPGWIFGAIFAVLVGAVIIGGIKSIARVTAYIVPFMCGIYMLACLAVIAINLQHIPAALASIFSGAFGSEAVAGGLVGVLIQGIKRAAFSNEAGLGSAPIAHSAVKTTKPASEGYVAMLEPFIDTVVVCTITALVIIITGTWKVGGSATENAALVSSPGGSQVVQNVEKGQFLRIRNNADGFTEVTGLISPDHRQETPVLGWIDNKNFSSLRGIPVTSMAFEEVISWFPKVLAFAVLLFAFSTMIAWSYYGEQGVAYLARFFGEGAVPPAVFVYKIVFCLMIIVGSSANLENILGLSDALVFAMVVPNLIGLYLLLPVVRNEAKAFLDHVAECEKRE